MIRYALAAVLGLAVAASAQGPAVHDKDLRTFFGYHSIAVRGKDEAKARRELFQALVEEPTKESMLVLAKTFEDPLSERVRLLRDYARGYARWLSEPEDPDAHGARPWSRDAGGREAPAPEQPDAPAPQAARTAFGELSLLAQAGANRSGGDTGFAGGAMVRGAFGSARTGRALVEGGLLSSGRGGAHSLVSREYLETWPSYYGETSALIRDVTRDVSGLHVSRVAGVGYQTPAFAGGRATLEAGVRLALATLNSVPTETASTYIRDWVRDLACERRGAFECYQERRTTIDSTTTVLGPGERRSAVGASYFAAMNYALNTAWGVRLEGHHDRFGGWREAGGSGASAGVTYNFTRR